MNWNTGEQELIPAGTYKVEIQKWEDCPASTGTPQIRWYATIIDGPYVGVTLLEHTATSEKALWRVAKFVSSCGVKVNALPEMQVGSELFNRVLDTCRGRQVNWLIEVSTYNGKKKNKPLDYIREAEQPDIDVEVGLEEEPDFLKEKDVV